MMKIRISLGSTRLWIFILLVILFILNFVVFHIYQQANVNEDFWTQLWKYLQSDAFKYLTISLILPILSLFLENLFELRKVVDERIEKEKQAGLEARWKCIEKTAKVWREFFNLINELIFLKNEADEETKKTSIQDIQKRIADHNILINERVNSWYFRFPNLRYEDKHKTFDDYVIYFTNMLYESANTIAYHLQKSQDPKEMNELRHTLFTIQDGVRKMLHQNMLIILKSSIDLWEGRKESDKAKISKAETMIKKRLQILENETNLLWREELENNEVLLTLEGGKGKALREACKKVEGLSGEYSEEKILESKEYLDFKELFNKSKHKDLVGMHRHYSLKWVRRLSDLLCLRCKCFYLLDRAEWTRDREEQK